MRNPSDSSDEPNLEDLIGLGERSYRKSYYPELQQRLSDLERFKAFVDYSHDAIFLVEVPSAEIVDANESACHQLDMERNELLGRSVFEISDLEQNGRARLLLRELAEEPRKKVLTEGRLCRLDQSCFPVEVTLAKMDFGESTYVIAVARDITKRKRFEAELAERIELAELGAEVGVALTLSESLHQTLRRCIESLVSHTGAIFGRIWTVDKKDPKQLVARASAGATTTSLESPTRRKVGELLIGTIAAERKPYFTNDVAAEPGIIARDWVEREGIVALAGYPLQVGDRLVGVVALFFRKSITDAVLGTIASVADEIAVGIDRQWAEEALVESEGKRQRMQAQLEVAAQMQASLLPTAPPRADGYDMAAVCLPAFEVGGDFYDWQETSPGLVTLTFGDIMGKGMAAAMLMATVRAALRTVSHATSPLASLHLAERALQQDLDRSDSFVTLFHAQLDVARHTLTFLDCGHGFGFLRRADGSVEELLPRGLPLGVVAGGYEEGRIRLREGDALVLYSDGLVDSLPEQMREREQVAQHLEGAQTARQMVDQLIAAVVAEKQLPLEDDLTVLVVLAPSAGKAE